MVHLLAKFTWSINMTNPLKDKRQDWFLGWSDLSTLTPKTENPQCFATFVRLFTDQEIKGTDVISTEKISNHSHNSVFPRVLRIVEKLDENLCSGASLGKNLSVFFREKGSGENSLVLVKNMLQKMGKLLAFQVPFPRLEEVQRADLNREKSQFSSVQFSRSVVSDSLQPLESQHTRPPCPSPTLEFTQTHAHRVGDAIQPPHPLSSPSPPAPNPSKHQGLFQWVNSLHEVAEVLEFQLQHQSFQWTPRTDLL